MRQWIIGGGPDSTGSSFSRVLRRFRAERITTSPNAISPSSVRVCHGEGGTGGDRAPALTNNRGSLSRTEAQIADLIKNGTPGGMPGFPLRDSELHSLASWVRSLNTSAFDAKPAQAHAAAGAEFFFGAGKCSTCHMVHGRGNVNGPDLSDIGRKSTVRELSLVLDNPTSQMGVHTTPTCPSWAFCPDEAWAVVNVRLRNGSVLVEVSEEPLEHDLQLQTFDGKIHLLTEDGYTEIKQEKESYMPALKSTPEEHRSLIACTQAWRYFRRSAHTFEAERILPPKFERT